LSHFDALRAAIAARRAPLCVVGLGYVGLPLAVELARAGFSVTGLDVDRGKVEAVRAGRSYIPDVPGGEVAALRAAGRLDASTDPAVLGNARATIICVPTPLRKTKDPDLSFVTEAARAVRQHLKAGQLVVLESTTYPGTTQEMVFPELRASGLEVGREFFLAFSPERVDPGNQRYNIRNTPKVVSGITARCRALAEELYGAVVERVVPVSSTQTAEMVKLLENTFRSVNIGLVNEIAIMCDRLGLDVWEVIDAAASKPFGFMPFYPGPGLGGHCIPVDPLYLSWKLKTLNFTSRFIELASEINGSMPRFVVQRVFDALNRQERAVKGSRILALGVAYKRDTSDCRESPALDVIELLRERGADLQYHDPFVPEVRVGDTVLRSVALEDAALTSAHCAVILADHSGVDYARVVRLSRCVVDARNATRNVTDGRERVIRL
jgi:UDP-N-acetyl-D-glucosamine dehydrogenase